MYKFTGKEMLGIDLANCYGLDKETWFTRLCWYEGHKHKLGRMIDTAKDSLLFANAVNAHELVQQGLPTGHIMYLDATASGLQIFAALTGCRKTALATNLINTGNREDVYSSVALQMNQLLVSSKNIVDRDLIKKPLMTHYYNKGKQETLNNIQQEAFYQVLSDAFPGPENAKRLINTFWDNNRDTYSFILPDKHVAYIRNTELIESNIPISKNGKVNFILTHKEVLPTERYTSLVPNIIHAIDGYIVRCMARMAKAMGIQLATIHDAFGTSPNDMQYMRECYVQILAEIADSNLLADILSELSGRPISIEKLSNNLSTDILQSEYALS